MGREHRTVGVLENADRIIEASVWVGCYPGLTDPMIDWIAESTAAFVSGSR
jgi:CDP-6-deoxy-D-xylo-4-hexulose-3-dehydrase